jgi:chromate reductase, NAD(P)H dehydrogenase (quinone)
MIRLRAHSSSLAAGCVRVSEPASGGAGNTYASLATILGYVDATVVTGACVRSPLGHLAVNEDGRIPDPAFRSLLATAAAALAAYLATKRSVEDPSP